jgi:hypothetical protein
MECRGGIDRWAGRSFDSDADRFAWWKVNKDKSPEQWLRNSLGITAQRADTADRTGAHPEAWLFHEVLPDAPYAVDESKVLAPRSVYILGTEQEPYRVKWLDQHRAELVYDANTGAFRLPHASPQ